MIGHTHRQRVNFLRLKANTLGLSADEQAELDRLQSIRITETPWAIIVEPQPMSLEEWKAMVQRKRGTLPAIIADEKHKNT